MPKIGINIEEIKERQPCPEGTYTLRIMAAEITANKQGDGRVVVVQLMPQEEPSYRVFKRWSLKPGVLSSSDPVFSFRKFVKDFLNVNSELTDEWDTDEIIGLEFMGKVSHEIYEDKARPILERVLASS